MMNRSTYLNVAPADRYFPAAQPPREALPQLQLLLERAARSGPPNIMPLERIERNVKGGGVRKGSEKGKEVDDWNEEDV